MIKLGIDRKRAKAWARFWSKLVLETFDELDRAKNVRDEAAWFATVMNKKLELISA